MKKCYLCNNNVSHEKLSDEHIIPESIGGRLVSKNLLCEIHNASLSEYDNEIASYYGEIATLVAASKRNKNKLIKMYTKDGESFAVGSGFGSTFEVIVETQYHKQKLEASSKEKLKQKVKDYVLKHIKVFWNEADKSNGDTVNRVLSELESSEKYIPFPKELFLKHGKSDSPINHSIVFTSKLCKGLLKIALNYALHIGVDKNELQDAINILKQDDDKFVNLNPMTVVPVLKHYFTFVNDDRSVHHNLGVIGCSDGGALIGVIELFSHLKVIVFLNMKYKGQDLQNIYSYDILNKKNKKGQVSNVPKVTTLMDFQFSKMNQNRLSEELTEKHSIMVGRINNFRKNQV